MLELKPLTKSKFFLENFYNLIKNIDHVSHAETLRLENLKRQVQNFTFTDNSLIDQFLEDNYSTLDSGNFPLLELIDLILEKSGLIKNGYRELVLKYSGIYILEKELSHEEIAISLSVTKERVRQLLVNEQVHIKALEQLYGLIEILKKYGLLIPSKFILINKAYHICQFQNLNNETNFSNKFFAIFLCQINLSYKVISFKIPDETVLLLDRWVLRVFEVFVFFEKILEIINNKIEEDFEIHFPGFMHEFYKMPISLEDQYKLEIAIESILYELHGLYPDSNKSLLIKRNIKKKPWEYMQDILMEANKPLHIQTIADEMQALGFEMDANLVRSYMLRMDEFFILLGSSIYGLKEWEKEQNMAGGTIKQVIEKLLQGSDEPVHLYEIAKHLMTHRNTNIHSIHGNLRSDPTNKFKFYGQQFYGLADKDYSKNYHYNRLGTHWFKDLVQLFKRNESNILAKSEILNYIARFHNVKQIQVEYLLSQRIEKGEVIEINDKLLQLK